MTNGYSQTDSRWMRVVEQEVSAKLVMKQRKKPIIINRVILPKQKVFVQNRSYNNIENHIQNKEPKVFVQNRNYNQINNKITEPKP